MMIQISDIRGFHSPKILSIHTFYARLNMAGLHPSQKIIVAIELVHKRRSIETTNVIEQRNIKDDLCSGWFLLSLLIFLLLHYKKSNK
ncbi:MAG: hypothetical protein ACI8RD_000882 [Bacillariaceae sp.]|jgi:hypothetical protein